MRVQIVCAPLVGKDPMDSAMTAVVLGGAPPFSFQWTINGEPVGTDSSRQTLQFTNGGGTNDYALSVTVTDAIGVSAEDTITVHTNP
jgi:membrane carboxypeptidase/penicillin-binding protein PbpC